MLCALGDLVEDVVVHVTGTPEPGTDNPAVVTRRRGGSAATVAAVAARRTGRARLVTQQGDDATGARLVAELRAAGVDVVGDRGGRTGTIVVLVDAEGERTFLTDRGCAADLAVADPAWLDGVDVLHVPAYGLVEGKVAAVAAALVAEAHRRGLPVSVDASSVSVLRGFGPDRFLDLLGRLTPTVLLANEHEAAVLGLVDPGGAVRRPPGVGTVVVKRGPAPTLVATADGPTVTVAPRPLGPVADSTGAGDAFAAGFLLALAGGASPADAAVAGNEVAAAHLSASAAEPPPEEP